MAITNPIMPDLSAATDVAKKAMVPLQSGSGGGGGPTPPPTVGETWPRPGDHAG
jgi:hypothetical protein